jgi:hypothetical protein
MIIGAIVFLFGRRNKKHPTDDPEWYLELATSKEDAISQSFITMSVFFLGATLLSFNRDIGNVFSWQTIILITSILGFICSYYLKTIYTILFSIIGITLWWAFSASLWMTNDGVNLQYIISIGVLFIALISYVVGSLHNLDPRYKRFSFIYSGLSILYTTIFLFVFSTKAGIDILSGITSSNSLFKSQEVLLSFFIFLVILLATVFYAFSRKLTNIYETIVIFLIFCLFTIVSIVPEQQVFLNSSNDYLSYQKELSSTGISWAFVFNIFSFLQLLGLILSGYAKKEKWLINIGTVFMFLFILFKYFDWFFTFLDKSVFFIGSGILLFVVGWSVEKGRRYMISHINSESNQILK